MKTRTTIMIEDELLTKVKILAVNKKTSFGSLVEEALKLLLKKENEKLKNNEIK